MNEYFFVVGAVPCINIVAYDVIILTYVN